MKAGPATSRDAGDNEDAGPDDGAEADGHGIDQPEVATQGRTIHGGRAQRPPALEWGPSAG